VEVAAAVDVVLRSQSKGAPPGMPGRDRRFFGPATVPKRAGRGCQRSLGIHAVQSRVPGHQARGCTPNRARAWIRAVEA